MKGSHTTLVDKYGSDADTRKPQPKHRLHILKFSLQIGENDKQRQLAKAKEFLGKHDQVRLVLTLRGREKSRPQVARDFLVELYESLDDYGTVAGPMKPGTYQITLNPKKK